MTTTWQIPATWKVPKDWVGERCFVLCTGESLNQQAKYIPDLNGRIIAVKHAVLLRPNADVLFLSGEGTEDVAKQLLPKFTGTYAVVRGKSTPAIADRTKRLTRTKDHTRLCDLPDHVAGLDSGTSAINLAHLFGATEIVVLGYDMVGGHFCKGHPLPNPPEAHFRRHMAVLPKMAEDAKARGIRIVNVSPISRVKCFERGSIEEFL